MGDDERLADLARTMTDIRVELGKVTERQKSIQQRIDDQDSTRHEEFERLRSLLFAELTGYVRGQMDSINGNINAVSRELAARSWRGALVIAGLTVFCAFIGAMVATLLAERFGFITRLPMP